MSATQTHGGQSQSRRLEFASTNPGKLREFSEAAAVLGVQVELLAGMASLPACVEDGETFEANARKKALHFAAFTGGIVFADDSGLSVDALGGAPGVYSARFAGAGASDETNNHKLLEQLSRAPGNLRGHIPVPPFTGFPAHYDCVVVAARGESILAIAHGRVDGLIIEARRGAGGFGYDPYFFYPPWRKTFAEVSASRKFTVSHRGAAFRELLRNLGLVDADDSDGFPLARE